MAGLICLVLQARPRLLTVLEVVLTLLPVIEEPVHPSNTPPRESKYHPSGPIQGNIAHALQDDDAQS